MLCGSKLASTWPALCGIGLENGPALCDIVLDHFAKSFSVGPALCDITLNNYPVLCSPHSAGQWSSAMPHSAKQLPCALPHSAGPVADPDPS
jgi:hypothetical protein